MYFERISKPKVTMVCVLLAVISIILAISSCAPSQNGSVADEQQKEQPAVSADSSNEGSGDAQTGVAFSMDSDCVMCHTKPAESEQNQMTVSYAHAQEDDIACTTCHSQEQELIAAHAEAQVGTEPLRLKTAKISDDTCLACHESYEALAEKTSDVNTLTDANGLVVNPHAAKQLNADHEADITCLKCHTEHVEKDETKSQNYCMNCHHMKVYECNTCHDTH